MPIKFLPLVNIEENDSKSLRNELRGRNKSSVRQALLEEAGSQQTIRRDTHWI